MLVCSYQQDGLTSFFLSPPVQMTPWCWLTGKLRANLQKVGQASGRWGNERAMALRW